MLRTEFHKDSFHKTCASKDKIQVTKNKLKVMT